MALDLNRVKARLTQLQSKGKKNADGSYEKTDYTKIYFKPKKGEQLIRIVPFKNQPNYPIMEVSFHQDIVKKKYLSLVNFGEKDPIVEFCKELRATGDKENKDLAWKLSPKTRYFCQVLVRGEEDKGVRLWEFGTPIEKEILKLINHKSYGDISDVHDGTDLTIEGVDDSFTPGPGKQPIKFISVSITPERDRSPLDDRESVIQSYLDNQHDPLTVGMKFTYDQILGFLEQWMSPEGDEATAGDAVAEEIVVEEPAKDALDEELEAGVDEKENAEENGDPGEEESIVEEEPPFIADPVVTKPRSAIAAASKKVIAKNNEEIKSAAETAKAKISAPKAVAPKVKTTAAVVKETPKVAPVVKAGAGGSNKDKFAALFPKK